MYEASLNLEEGIDGARRLDEEVAVVATGGCESISKLVLEAKDSRGVSPFGVAGSMALRGTPDGRAS